MRVQIQTSLIKEHPTLKASSRFQSNRMIINPKIYFYPRIASSLMNVNTTTVLLLLGILLQCGACYSVEGDWTLRTSEIPQLSTIKKPIRFQFDRQPTGVDQQITGYLTITACNIMTYNFEVEDSQIFLTFVSIGRSTRKCEAGELVFIRTQLDQTFYFYIQYTVMIFMPPNTIPPIKLDRIITNTPPSINGVWIVTDAVSFDKINDSLVIVNGSEMQLCRGQNSFAYKIANYPDINLTRKSNGSCNTELSSKIESIAMYKFNPTTPREIISFYDANGTLILEITNQETYLAGRPIIFDKITANAAIKKDQSGGIAFWNIVNGIETDNKTINTSLNNTTNLAINTTTNITINSTANVTTKNINITTNSSNNSVNGSTNNTVNSTQTNKTTPLPSTDKINTTLSNTTQTSSTVNKTTANTSTNSNITLNSSVSNTSLSTNTTKNQTIIVPVNPTIPANTTNSTNITKNQTNTTTTANITNSSITNKSITTSNTTITTNITNTTVKSNQTLTPTPPTAGNLAGNTNSTQPKLNSTNNASSIPPKNDSQSAPTISNTTINPTVIEKPVFVLVNAASDIFDVWYPYNTDQIQGLSALPQSNNYQILINAQRIVLAGGCNTLFSKYTFSSPKFQNISVNSPINTCPNNQDTLLQNIIFNSNNSYYFASINNPKQKLINIVSDKGTLLLQLTTITPKTSVASNTTNPPGK